ncbi:DUF4192 domain-containing protein [Demequina aurantiaca]|uniref:DUF4192 domain-containing protein n=1 Tax=Demequina aurantiaca TaxID=676200 RepID=UPI0007843C16|nr:DUF4192 domain-containing protein [Demequina aurantiaca]
MTIPTLRGPGELLATLPSILGFTPVESVVIVGIRHGGEIGAIMRVDREDCLVSETLEPMSRAVAAQLARDATQAVILVSYTDCPVRVCCEAADALRAQVADTVPQVDTWAVARGRYFAPGCADVACCPIEGRAVPEPTATMVPNPGMATMCASPSHSRSRNLWGTAPALERRRCARAADRWAGKGEGDEDTWRRRSLELWQQHLIRGMSPEAVLREADMGKLIAGIADVRVRDSLIVWLIPGSSAAIDDVLAGIPSEAVSRALDAILDPQHAMMLDDVQCAALRRVIGACVANGRRKDAAPLLAVHALVEWWAGDAEAGLSLCGAAIASAPGYRLAELIRATIRAGITPGWQAQGGQLGR